MSEPTAPTAPEEKMLQLFRYEHLKQELQEISKPFCELARSMCEILPANAERSAMLRKLREAKDCAVTAKFYK